MKLIYCPHPDCSDVVKLCERRRVCGCGRSWGQDALDRYEATYGGSAVPLGFDGPSLVSAVANQCERDSAAFTAFVIPRKCATFTKE